MSPSCRGSEGHLQRPSSPCGGAAPGFWGPVVEERPGGVGRGAVRTRPCAAHSRRRPLGAAASRWPGSRPSGLDRAVPASAVPPAFCGEGLGLRPVPSATGPARLPAGARPGRGEQRPLRACPPPGSPGARFQRADGTSALPWTRRRQSSRGRSRAHCFRAEARARRRGGGGQARGEPSLEGRRRGPAPAAAPACRPELPRAGHFLSQPVETAKHPSVPKGLLMASHRNPLCRGTRRPPPARSTSSRFAASFLPAASLSLCRVALTSYFFSQRTFAIELRHTHTAQGEKPRLFSVSISVRK